MWFNYQSFYSQIAALPDMNRLVEVGCWRGDSIVFLAKKLVEAQRPFELWGVDIWEQGATLVEKWNYNVDGLETAYAAYNRALIEAGVRDRVVDLRMVSLEAARAFADGSLDFVFLDADHRPQSVLADIKAWLPKVRPQGILAGHDYYYETVGYQWDNKDNVAEGVNEAVRQKIIKQPQINANISIWMTQV